jgi:4'-phosphopantetheinyl transferase
MDDVTIRWARPGLSDSDRQRSLAALSPRELDRLTVERDPDGFLQGRLMLRDLAVELGVANPIVDATCPDCGGPHGAPRIRDSNLRVSLSRCAGAVVVAGTLGRGIGVDVELAGADAAGVGSIARWTTIEAVLKADGRGLRVDPDAVTIDGDIAWVRGSVIRYRILTGELDPGLEVRVAVEL